MAAFTNKSQERWALAFFVCFVWGLAMTLYAFREHEAKEQPKQMEAASPEVVELLSANQAATDTSTTKQTAYLRLQGEGLYRYQTAVVQGVDSFEVVVRVECTEKGTEATLSCDAVYLATLNE